MTKITTHLLELTCPAFEENGFFPEKYSCYGRNISPEINIHDLPRETRSMAVVLLNEGARQGTYVHWLMWNIPPHGTVTENFSAGVVGKNSKGEHEYTGPCPAEGAEKYRLRVFALDRMLDLPRDITVQELLKALGPHIIAEGELTGKYGR